MPLDEAFGGTDHLFAKGKAMAVGGNAKAACFECHTRVKAGGYVFSRWRP